MGRTLLSLCFATLSFPLLLRKFRPFLFVRQQDTAPTDVSRQACTRGKVRTGIECLAQNGFKELQNCRVGVIANATSVLPDLTHLVDALHEAPGVTLVAVFGPEHGFRGGAQAGGSEGSHTDPRTSVPVHDLYLKSGRALAALFEGARVDTLLFDIQDVGVRFYTYIWTLYDCMVAAARANRPIRFIVADRPNPIGGLVVDGPIMRPEFSSFVGRKPIALRHGMSVGELARLFNAEFVPSDAGGKQVALHVVPTEGWTRGMLPEAWGLPWVAPSPNMPSPATATLYPGMGLFEGTNVSEGRGTTLPFELIGAPWMDFKVVLAAREANCPGVLFREACFTPTFSKYSGTAVRGLQVHLCDKTLVNPLQVAITLLVIIKKLYPTHFTWRCDGGSYWVDKLTGNGALREGIERGSTADEVMSQWHDDVVWFNTVRALYLLYPNA